MTLADIFLRAATQYPADTVNDDLDSTQRDQNWQVFIYLWTQLVTDMGVQTYDRAVTYNNKNNKWVSYDYGSTGLRIFEFISATPYAAKEPGDPANSTIWVEASITEFIANIGGNIQTELCASSPDIITIGDNTDLLILNPIIAIVPIASYIIDPPVNPRLNRDIRISAGGDVATGNVIITTITWGTNFTGTHIKGVLPTSMKSGDMFILTWDGTNYRVVSIYKQ